MITSISRTSVNNVRRNRHTDFAMSTCPGSAFRKMIARVHLKSTDDADDADSDADAIIACRIMVSTRGPSLGLGPHLATGVAVCVLSGGSMLSIPGGTLHFAPRRPLVNGGSVIGSYRDRRGI